MTLTVNETPEVTEVAQVAEVTGEDFAAMMGEAGQWSRLVMLDPGTLTVGQNARAEVVLGREFVASIKDHGVLQPIVAVRGEDGATVVRLGQRRTLAAVRAGLDRVPVWLIEASGDEAERIVAQMVENDHRDAMTDRDRVAAVEQLSLLGMTAAKIAKKLHRPRDEVKAALSVAKSATARAALTATGTSTGTSTGSTPGDGNGEGAGVRVSVPLTLAQAALVAEFDDDAEDVAQVVAAIETGSSGEHVAQRIRDRRAKAKAKDKAERAARADGLTVVSAGDGAYLADLVDADGEPLTNHHECPGHAVYLAEEWVEIDARTGQPIPDDDPEDTDPDEADTDTDEGEGEGEAATTWAQLWQRVEVCTDPDAHGHYWDGEAPGQQDDADDDADDDNADEGEEAQERAARDDAARKAAEQRAEADRRARERHEAWQAARTVRRAWIGEHIAAARKPPAGAAQVIAREAAANRYGFASATIAREWLGIETEDAVQQAIATATEPRALVIALVHALAKAEDVYPHSPDGLRGPFAAKHRAYLDALTGWGYELAPIEADAITPDEATDDEATDDEATDDEATDDEATDDEATDDEATDGDPDAEGAPEGYDGDPF